MARPAAFDRDEVLGRAMQAFWDHGYCAPSVSQLVEATRLKPGSLYAAFDSKEGLFLAALDHYAAFSKARLRQALDEADGPLQGIEGFLRQMLQAQYATTPPRGCLLVNSILELGRQNPAVRERIKAHLDAIEAELCRALIAARAAGALADRPSPQARARLLMTTIWGLRVLGGTGADLAQAEQVLEQVIATLHGR
jgi:TetR/AcrR family transcriptional repressor of nem operon